MYLNYLNLHLYLYLDIKVHLRILKFWFVLLIFYINDQFLLVDIPVDIIKETVIRIAFIKVNL